MQSQKYDMRDLAGEIKEREELIKSRLSDPLKTDNFNLTADDIEDLTRQGIVVVPKTTAIGPTKVISLADARNPAFWLAATKQALEAEGKSQPVKRNKILTREDFPSRQAWRNYQRQKAKGY